MIKMVTRPNRIFSAALISCCLIFCSACQRKTETRAGAQLQDSLIALSKLWKADSLGCLRGDKIDGIKVLVDGLRKANADSNIVLKNLGNPNHRMQMHDTLTFIYFLECGNGVSHSNFSCNFKDGVLFNYSTSVF